MMKFKVESGKLCVSDPCYARHTGERVCGLYGIPALNGEWVASAEISDDKSWGDRVAVLEAKAVGTHGGITERSTCAVDSGQLGIFDDGIYPLDGTGEYGDLKTFYGRCCEATLESPNSYETVDGHGVVSSSGYGDGSYDCEVQYKDGLAVAVKVTFIDDRPTCMDCGEYEDYCMCDDEDDE